jgi:vancomycin resistance protein YoaR
MARSEPISFGYSAPANLGVPWRRAGFTFLLTLLAIAIFGASFAVGYARVHEGRILPGVDVGGVSLAGLDRTAAVNKLRQSLPDLSGGQLIIAIGPTSQSVTYSALRRDYDIEFMLDQALGVGRGPNFIEQLQEQLRVLLNGTSVSPAVRWDNDTLARTVAQIAMAAQYDPVNASISRVDGRYVVNPSSDGQSVDVEGAVASALAAIDNTSPADAQVTINTSVVPPAIDTAEAQAAADLAESVAGSDVRMAGQELSTALASDALRGWVHLEPTADGSSWQLVIERAPIAQAISNYALQTDVAPANATFAFQGGDVTVVPSSDGRATDVEATTDNVMAVLEARSRGETPPDATLVLGAVAPVFGTAAAQALAPRITKLSEWTTRYIPSPLNGEGVNIQIPTSIIDGYVVEPGGTFDFLDVIGPITSPPYTEGAAIRNGRTVLDGVLGGGMCSCSTTLFNAALRAGLAIIERANHAYYISRYPLGLDATVWIASAHSQVSMVFVNDNQYPILIRGINEPGKVTFELYGVDDGRTVELSDPRIENPKKAVEQVQYTDSLSPGVEKRVEFNTDGLEVWVTRTVRDANGAVIHLDEFHSKYRTIDGITQVGRYPGDPVDGTTIPASQYHPSGPAPTP